MRGVEKEDRRRGEERREGKLFGGAANSLPLAVLYGLFMGYFYRVRNIKVEEKKERRFWVAEEKPSNFIFSTEGICLRVNDRQVERRPSRGQPGFGLMMRH